MTPSDEQSVVTAQNLFVVRSAPQQHSGDHCVRSTVAAITTTIQTAKTKTKTKQKTRLFGNRVSGLVVDGKGVLFNLHDLPKL